MKISHSKPMKHLVIPDIHGSASMLDTILLNFPNHKYIFLGDIFDRGYKVKEVASVISRLEAELYALPAVRLMGNHELMTYTALSLGIHSEYGESWLFHGGDKTMQSYSNSLPDVFSDVCEYIRCSVSHVNIHILEGPLSGKTMMVAHAARPRIDSSGRVHGEHHLWDRPGLSMYSSELCDFSIHGHTPQKTPTFDIQNKAGYIDLGNFFSGSFCVYCPEDNKVTVFKGENMGIDYDNYQMVEEINNFVK